MWNLSFTAPQVIEARVLTRLPDAFRRKVKSEWGDANMPRAPIDSFLEGPSFDRAGNLYVTDIPHGRIFRISPGLEWTLAAEYDGWPNGIAIHRDGALWIADYRRGLLRWDGQGEPAPILARRNSESFRGLNDLTFDAQGNC
jgi:gluconolactonase